jgi:hypothetical protein
MNMSIKVKKQAIETIKESALRYFKDSNPITARDNLLAESYVKAVTDWLEKEHKIPIELKWDLQEDKDSLENF